MRDTASAASPEINVTCPHHHGQGRGARPRRVARRHEDRVLAAPAARPETQEHDPKQPNWKIYQYDATAKTVTQLTNDDVTAGHDVGAHYLPDGRIVFASTRQLATQAILLDEGRPQYQAVTTDQQQAIFLLHVMNARRHGHASDQLQHQSRFRALGLANGQIVFSRWDTDQRRTRSACTSPIPDGTGRAALLWREQPRHRRQHRRHQQQRHSVLECAPARRRQAARHRPARSSARSSAATSSLIDAQNFVEINQPSSPDGTRQGPGRRARPRSGVTTDANMPSAGRPLLLDVSALRRHQPHAGELGAVPDPDHRRHHRGLQQHAIPPGANVMLAPPQYTVWVYDFDAGTLEPAAVRRAGHRDRRAGDPAGPHARCRPSSRISRRPTPPSKLWSTTRSACSTSRSVYDFDGVDTAKPSIATQAEPGAGELLCAPGALRPHREGRRDPAEDGAQDQSVRLRTRRHGHARDPGLCAGPAGRLGVRSRCPRNVPFIIDVLDANARRITAQHTSWMQVHARRNQVLQRLPHGRQSQDPSHGRSGLTVRGQPGRADHGSALSRAPTARSVRQCGRDHGANARAHQLRDRQRTRKPGRALHSAVLADSRDRCDLRADLDRSASPRRRPTAEYRPLLRRHYLMAAPPAFRARRPTNGNCAPWSAQCRITIHYANPASNPTQLFIQNLWNDRRAAATVNGVANTQYLHQLPQHREPCRTRSKCPPDSST